MSLQLHQLASLCLCTAGITLLAVWFRRLPGAPRPASGRRGLARSRALDDSAAFRAVEPIVARVSMLLHNRLPSRVYKSLELRLGGAGSWLGLSPADFVGLVIVMMVLGAALVMALLVGYGSTPTALLAGAAAGGAIPTFRLGNARMERAKSINRGLPPTIDLAALCMASGLDFTNSLQLIVDQSADGRDAIVDELRHMLRNLKTGHTRSHALEEFGRSAQLPAVDSLVAAVVQADRKGNPLREVMQIQAAALRMKRSAAAEEAAARAGVLLIVPMLFLMGSVILLLVGRFIVTGFAM